MTLVRTAVDSRPTASRVGSYEILHRFATGGMAELFLARSVGPEGFEKLVVLKKILPHLADNEKFVQLFLGEARLAASLDHPNIVHVYDLGTVDGNYFLTMEHVHGRDLRNVLHRCVRAELALPIQHAVHVARDIAAALHYAHERRGSDGGSLGIVHRDVSPANVMLSFEGAVKLLDFGVAKAATSSSRTRTGALKGKVAYMSPEQARGEQIDRRSDIFAAGIVLWEMVTTKRLFKTDNDLATIQKIIHEPVPAPSTVRTDCPAELDRIIVRALAKDGAARYQTAQELQLDLEELARETKLHQSSVALAAQMTALFADELAAWQQAQAAGTSLADHLIAMSSAAAEPTPSSDFLSEQSVDDLPTGVAVDAEPTQRTEAPVVVTTPPVKKKKRIRDRAITDEPSIVIDPGLVENQAEPVPVTPLAGAIEPDVAHRRSPRTTWIAIAAGVLGLGVGILLVSRGGAAKTDTAPAPAVATPAPAPPPPAPAPPPPPPEPVAPVDPSPPAHAPPPAKVVPAPKPHPRHPHPAKPAAAKKFDPDAAMPPM